jgi:hypothetical protein
MPYRLKNGIFQIRCRYPGCPFHSQVTIEQKIMGMTEKDVEQESKNLARDIGRTKHDAIYGTRHGLRNPDVRRVSGTYELIGASPDDAHSRSQETMVQEYDDGEVILKQGQQATTICEVLRGSAYPERNPAHRYGPGDCFGASALLANHNRTCDVIAGKDGTRIAFHNLIELSRRNPKKATRLFQAVMEDTLVVIQQLEQSVMNARREIEREAVRG